MFWLRSFICQVRPPSSERYNAFLGGAASTNAYTTLGFDGATATATRPQGFGGRPAALVAVSSLQVAPPSVVLNKPLPLGASGRSPPERKAQPSRRKSPSPAKSVLGAAGSIDTLQHPVGPFAPHQPPHQRSPPSP